MTADMEIMYWVAAVLNIVDESAIYIFTVWKCVLVALVGCGICPLLVFLFSVTVLKCMQYTNRRENDHTLLYTGMYEYMYENAEERACFYIRQGQVHI